MVRLPEVPPPGARRRAVREQERAATGTSARRTSVERGAGALRGGVQARAPVRLPVDSVRSHGSRGRELRPAGALSRGESRSATSPASSSAARTAASSTPMSKAAVLPYTVRRRPPLAGRARGERALRPEERAPGAHRVARVLRPGGERAAPAGPASRTRCASGSEQRTSGRPFRRSRRSRSSP